VENPNVPTQSRLTTAHASKAITVGTGGGGGQWGGYNSNCSTLATNGQAGGPSKVEVGGNVVAQGNGGGGGQIGNVALVCALRRSQEDQLLTLRSLDWQSRESISSKDDENTHEPAQGDFNQLRR
jgi:hypothetical protein